MKWIRRIMYLFLFLLLLLVGAYFALTSNRGLDYLAAKASALASSDGQVVEITGLRGQLYRDITIAQLRLADAEGVWLELHDIHVQWNLRQALRKQPPLEKLEIAQVILLRQPVPAAASTQTSPATPNEIPSLRLIASYLPREINIADIRIDEGVTGMAQRLRIAGAGNADAYRLQLNTLEGPQTTLDATIKPQAQDFTAQIAFTEAAGGLVGTLAGLPNNAAMEVKLDTAADVKGNIHVKEGALHVGTLAATVAGEYQLETSQVDASVTVNAPDMEIIQALAATPISGSAQLALTLRGTPDALHATLAATTPHMMVDGSRITNAALDVDANTNVSAWGTDAFVASVKLDAKADYNATATTLNMQASLAENTLSVPAWQAQYGDMRAKGSLAAEGNQQQFSITSDTELTTPYGPSTLALKGNVDSVKQQYQGTAKGRFTYLKEAFDFASTVDADAARAKLSGLSLKGPGADIAGDVEINIPQQLADGKLRIRMADLAPLGRIAQQAMSGSLNADVVLKANGSKQAIDLTATAEKLAAAGIHIAQMQLAAKSDDIKTLQTIDARMNGQGIEQAGLHVDKVSATAKGSFQKNLDVVLDAEGKLDTKPWKLALGGQAAQPATNQFTVKLARLDASYDNAPIHLQNPATFTHTAAHSELTPLAIAIAEGTITAKGAVSQTRVEGGLEIAHLQLDKLPTLGLPQGTLNVTLGLGGTAAAPALSWKATSALTLEGMKIAANAEGTWKDKLLHNTATIVSDKATATAEVKLPAALSLAPFAMGINEQTTLAGKVVANLPLSMLNTQLRASGQRIDGTVAGNATLLGTVGNPAFEGGFTLSGGRYDHTQSGVCLRDMTAKLSGSKQEITLEHFKAVDSNQHAFNASGKLALAGTPTVSGKAAFDHFRLFCGGMTSGQIDGEIGMNGTLQAMSVAGKLVLGPLNVQIPGARAAGNIPNVETVWIKKGKPVTKTEDGRIALDIAISAPNQLYVRGRGLDAEFAGDLHITGTAQKPVITGQFDNRRGKFVLLDRVMTLKTASLQFEGPIPPSPFLNVAAETVVNTNTITMKLTGSAAKPVLALTSEPTLPQDELLALLLFGRQLKQISPFEALRLAQATRELAGLDDGGPGLLGSVRDTLGLDTLDVGTDSDNNMNISTGKYVSDSVYVGVNQGAKPEDRKVVTEITLTPSVSGKTSVDSVGNQGVGLEWKHDY